MGISPPSLYAAFGDKERLFLEAVEFYRSGPMAAQSCAFAQEPTARRAIARLLAESAANLSASGRPPGCMVVTAATNCSTASAHLQSALAEHRAESETTIRERIERGIAEGDVPRGVDAEALAKFYVTVLYGMTIQARDGAPPETLAAIGETAMRAWPTPTPRPRQAG
jgi:AcrR family transcriptional regulator